MLQIVVRSRARLFCVLDSEVPRLTGPALNEGLGAVPAGHYKLGPVRRRARSTWEGPGRITVRELNARDSEVLSGDPRVHGVDGVNISIVGLVAPVRSLEGKTFAIAGGSTAYGSIAFANYQPLTPAPGGLRIHNAHLERLMTVVETWLGCDQLVILTVLEG